MPHVSKQGLVARRSDHNRDDMRKTAAIMPRDHLKNAFAGHENNGPASKGAKSQSHSTNVKSRASKASKFKTPKR